MRETIELMQERAERLGKFLRHLLDGEDIPDEVIDDAVRMAYEAADQYLKLRSAKKN